MLRIRLIIIALLIALPFYALSKGFSVEGRVIDKITREPVEYAAVYIARMPQKGSSTDSLGGFKIENIDGGIYRLQATFLGYKDAITEEFTISASTPYIEIEIQSDARRLEAVIVRPTVFRSSVESPVSRRVISFKEIEKSPGANRDVSRIVRSYPGVAYSPVGYRNDLIVRGGGPAENRFFLDGIEIPNINHFSTQGASGGPVGIINADLVREIEFYTGAFAANRAGAMSSVLDIKLRDGNPNDHTFKATLGASEVGISGSGHIGDRTTYLFSLRQSYLQLLFKLLGLPFLPNYIDGTVKVKHKLSKRDEITFLALAGFDDMKLNLDETSEENEYLLGYLPTIKQETYTVGASYRHFSGNHAQRITLSHNYLNNREQKYLNNDDSTEDNLTLRLRGVEQKTTLRFENRTYLSQWSIRAGAEATYSTYDNNTIRASYTDTYNKLFYTTDLGILGWGAFVNGDYTSPSSLTTISLGLRFDGNDYSSKMSEFWRQLSPRASIQHSISNSWSISASAGIYYQLPPYTALGFKNNEGELVNYDLDYQRVVSTSLGVEYKLGDELSISSELFYKYYSDMPLSVVDGIPLACKGVDYGAVGDELLISSASGRAYGIETLGRWQPSQGVYLVGSFTYYRSQYRATNSDDYIDSAWDNRFIVNISGVYDLPRNWSIGGRLSAIGGAPYTPYDVDKSSLVEAWDAQLRPYLDYSQYNTLRGDAYAQLDLRVDKSYYFQNWMLGIYIDLQNVTSSKYSQAPTLISTGKVVEGSSPPRYEMKYLDQSSGTIIPTIGITVEF